MKNVSLFIQRKKTKMESKRLLGDHENQYMRESEKTALCALCGLCCMSLTAFLAVIIGIFVFALGVAGIVVGSMAFINNWICEEIPQLATWLVSFGCISVFSMCTSGASSNDGCGCRLWNFFVYIVSLAFIIGLIMGTIWVVEGDPRGNDFATCNEILWTASYTLIVTYWVFAGFALCLICCSK